jgi:hypothetical protein
MWKKVFMAKFKYDFQHVRGLKTFLRTSIRIVSVLGEIRTRHLQSTSQKLFR